MRVNVVGESENRLARYLARDSDANRTRLVMYMRMIGRVKELWMLDMRLGPCHGDFEAILEDEYDKLMMEADEENDVVVEVNSDDDIDEEEGVDEDDRGQDVQMVLAGADGRGMGQRGA